VPLGSQQPVHVPPSPHVPFAPELPPLDPEPPQATTTRPTPMHKANRMARSPSREDSSN
jgi:hypothetical protein